MNYKFKEGEEGKPVLERTIEKTGSVQEFSLTGMYHDNVIFEKTLKEARANMAVKKAVCDNIEQHHPFVKDLPEIDRYTIHMYQENMAIVKAWSEKIAELEKGFEDHKAEIEEIKAQVPELADTVSPYIEQPAPEVPKVTDVEINENKTKPKKAPKNAKEELSDEVGKYISLKTLHDSEGGQMLIEGLTKDILDAVDILCANYSELTHIQTVALISRIKERRDILLTLTQAKSQLEINQDLLAEEIKKEKENPPKGEDSVDGKVLLDSERG